MFFSKKVKINVKNKNVVIEAKSGSNLYEVLVQNGIPIESLCKGSGQCGKCKVKIVSADGKEINKPTKKDRLILAKINLDNGYRLACQYVVKSDIIVDTEEWIVEDDPNILKVTVKKVGKPTSEDNKSEENLEKDYELSDKQFDDDAELKALKDGLILIQYPKGIKYFVYSASIGTISFDGYVKTDEPLIDLIDNNLLSDFIYNNVDVPDIDRVLIILDSVYYKGENLLNLIEYYSFEIGEMFCEIIQPLNNPSNLLTFFRLLNLQDGSLLIPLDSLTSYYFKLNEKLYLLDAKYISNRVDLGFLFQKGLNPITDISNDFKDVQIKDPYFEPDSISPKAIMKTIYNLSKFGIIDDNFRIKDRNDLLDKVPIEILVKISKKGDETKFNVYRKKEISISVSDKDLYHFYEFKKLVNSLVSYTEKFLGKISNIVLYSYSDIEEVINILIGLKIFPNKYAKKITFFSGDPALLSIKFFSYKNIPAYLNKNFKELNSIELYKNENFNNIFEKF
ncbi:2Fe-2S iron-sulfur cluster-binding protein [Deferribacter thermophilus]|uniref:2Fe-2S iron-sulfur cluster-binding protein n=1 Tax=Deferribacter thermophilus TaxID=53573 RepID=UPI003C23A3C2